VTRERQTRLRRGASAAGAVVDNLPEVPSEKFEKLSSVVHKIFSKAGSIRPGERPCPARCSLRACFNQPWARTDGGCALPDGLLMPIDSATKVSKGFAFIEFSAPQVCARALRKVFCLPARAALHVQHSGSLASV